MIIPTPETTCRAAAIAGQCTGTVSKNGRACRQMLPMMTGASRDTPLSRFARPAPSSPPSAEPASR